MLTNTKVKNAKPAPDGRPYKLTDGGGLHLFVSATGARLWRYKFRLAGKEQLFSIGAYPSISVAGARAELAKARELVSRGEHPRVTRELERLKSQHERAETFATIAIEWFTQKRDSWSPYYGAQIQRSLTVDVFPSIGLLPIRKVTRTHLYGVIKAIEGRGAAVVAENVRKWCSSVFRYAMQSDRADSDPAASLVGVVHRPKIKHNLALNPDQVRDLLVRLDDAGGNRTTRIAVELLLLTFVRTAELRKAIWAEFDQKNPTLWRIPAERMKMDEEHLVPLSAQARALIDELRTITGASKWLFPNYRRPDDVMTATTINRALERMGLNGIGTLGFSAHGFRGTASTLLHERGFQPEAIERQLAHAKRNQVQAAYNKAQYLEIRVQMMQHWADFIDSLRPKKVGQ